MKDWMGVSEGGDSILKEILLKNQAKRKVRDPLILRKPPNLPGNPK